MKIIRPLVIFLLLSAPLLGYEIDAGRSLGMGGTIMLTAPSATDLLLDPVALNPDRQALIESGYQRRYDLPELEKGYFAAGYRRGSFSFALGASQFGKDDYYSEKILRTSIGYYYRFIGFAIVGSGKSTKFGNNYGSFSANSIGLAGALNYKEYHLAIVADNLNDPKLVKNGKTDPFNVKVLTEVKGSKSFSVTGKMGIEKNQKLSLSLGQYIFVSGKNVIYWGLSGNPLTYGGGLELSYSKFVINYSVNYHPALGISHNISLGAAFKP